jgi:hypothetical protein
MSLNEMELFCSKRGNPHYVIVQKKSMLFCEKTKYMFFVKLKCCNTMMGQTKS